jgi:hypothetical protein
LHNPEFLGREAVQSKASKQRFVMCELREIVK